MAYLEYKPEGTLYHFTTPEGFHGITTSRRLWLTDMSNTNDPRDIHIGLTRLKNVIEDVRSKHFPGDLGSVVRELHRLLVTYTENWGIFTASFTHLEDNINVWREYSDRGRGLAIGFRNRALDDTIGRMYRVRYINEDTDAELSSLLVRLFEPLKTENIENLLGQPKWVVEVVSEMVSMVLSLKHVSWSYEDEVRLSLASAIIDKSEPTIIGHYRDGKPFYRKPPQQISKGDRTLIYQEMEFGKYNRGKYDHRRSIEKVIIGPNCSMSRNEVHDILVSRGFEGVSIQNSDCRFR